MVKRLINLRFYVIQLVILFTILFGFQFMFLVNGDVVNYYPYITPDGFDWYVEGIYLVKLLGGASLPELPVLRPPIFVFVTAADYALGNQGLVLSIILSLSIFCTFYFSLMIVDSVYAGTKRNEWYIVPLAVGSTIYALNFLKPYLLADGLAVALALASVSMFIRYQIESKAHQLILSTIFAVVAGMTQTYAIIPYLIVSTISVVLNLRLNNRKAIIYLLLILSTLLAFVVFTLLWRWSIPHSTTPQNFVLLKLSTNMFEFYISVWSYYFAPFIIFFIFYRKYQFAKNPKNLIVLSTLSIVLLFSVLCFFYQWKEARFTYYFWPWLMVLFFSTVRVQSMRGGYFITLLMLLHTMSVPENYWSPTWASVHGSVRHNWVGDYFSASSVDRKINACSNGCNEENEFLKNSDSYVNSTIDILNNIKGLK